MFVRLTVSIYCCIELWISSVCYQYNTWLRSKAASDLHCTDVMSISNRQLWPLVFSKCSKYNIWMKRFIATSFSTVHSSLWKCFQEKIRVHVSWKQAWELFHRSWSYFYIYDNWAFIFCLTFFSEILISLSAVVWSTLSVQICLKHASLWSFALVRTCRCISGFSKFLFLTTSFPEVDMKNKASSSLFSETMTISAFYFFHNIAVSRIY